MSIIRIEKKKILGQIEDRPCQLTFDKEVRTTVYIFGLRIFSKIDVYDSIESVWVTSLE